MPRTVDKHQLEEKNNTLQFTNASHNSITLVCLCCGETVYKFQFDKETNYKNGQPWPQSPIVLCYNCFYYRREGLGLPEFDKENLKR